MSKRSGANWNSKPPEPPVLFIDRSLGNKKVAEALRAAGASVEVHSDHFPEDAKDEAWLRAVGERGWVVLTKDKGIRYNELERRALLSRGVRAFVMTAGNVTGDEMAKIFVKVLPKIRRLLRKHRGAFIARITRSGFVSVIESAHERRS